MTALFPVSSIADVRDVFRGKDVTWQFPRTKRSPSSAKSCSSGNGKEDWEGAAAEGPHEHGTAAGWESRMLSVTAFEYLVFDENC